MELINNREGDILTIQIDGRVDTVTAPELEKAINANIDDVKELVLDMKNMDYISSAGLRVLLIAHKKMNQKGKMKLINVSDNVMDIFDVTGFTDILTIK